jgi:PAS domain S-box-containing protein
MASGAGRPGVGTAELVLMHDLLLRLPAGVAYVAGPDLVFEFANEEFRRTVGGHDLVGIPLRRALPEEAREHLDLVENVARTGEPRRGRESEVWVRGHGEEPERLFVDYVYQPVRDEAGGVAGVLLYGTDVTAHVTDRRRLEELAQRLVITEERYRTLFETLPLGVIHYHADGSILGANPAAAEILGLAPDAITSWPLIEARRAVQEDGTPFEPSDVPVMVALRTGEIVADVVAGLPHGRSGELRWLRVTAVPDARDAQGRPQRGYAMLTDITEQRRAEAAVRQNNRLLGRLRESNVLGVVVSSEAGVHDANDAFLDIIGRPRDDLESGRISWRAITPGKWAATDDDALAQLRRTGACRPYEKEYLHSDGHRVPVLVGAAVIDWRPLRWTTFAVDLTARQRGEQERATLLRAFNAELEERVSRRTSELVRAEADRRALEAELRRAERLVTVGQLTSGIAHDFGNLLAVIVGYAEMAADVSDDLHPELRRILDEIHVAADRAVHLSSDLLSFSSRARTRPEAIELNALIAGIRDLLDVSMSGCAEVSFEPWPRALPAVLADRGRLEQVLLNLAVNARDAMPDGGKLTITTGPADLDGRRLRLRPGADPRRYVELAVTDTGTGMSEQVQARIFERFFTTKSPGTGTGLGLSTVHGIIADAGGIIDVDSEEGRGTTFRIYLPAAVPAAPAQPS